jgi:KipI family sensor histidine kinase inhibitor
VAAQPDVALPARLLDAGDSAVTVEFGNTVSPDLVARVAAFEQAVDTARASGALPGVVETVPTFRSLTVLYDPLRTCRAVLDPVLKALLDQDQPARPATPRRWRLPVCYGGSHGADLAAVASACGQSPDAVVRLHAGADFTVYMLGFMPGFAFMGGLPEALSVPRRAEPRLRVPAGSVAITGGLTAIYPWESPGGWHLLGRCPVPLFDTAAPAPVLLAPGDRVSFEPVSAARHAELEAALRAGSLLAEQFLQPAAASAAPR